MLLVDHSAKPGTGSADAGRLHRIDEAFAIRDFEAHGLKVVAKSDILRSPTMPGINSPIRDPWSVRRIASCSYSRSPRRSEPLDRPREATLRSRDEPSRGIHPRSMSGASRLLLGSRPGTRCDTHRRETETSPVAKRGAGSRACVWRQSFGCQVAQIRSVGLCGNHSAQRWSRRHRSRRSPTSIRIASANAFGYGMPHGNVLTAPRLNTSHCRRGRPFGCRTIPRSRRALVWAYPR